MKKIGMTIVLGLGCFLLQTSLASPPVCVVQFAKDVCWQSHRVTLHVYDVKQFKDVGPPIVLTKDASFIEASFPCQAGQNITFKASFLPEMWGSKKPRLYQSKQIWNVPMKFAEGVKKWVVTLCFSKDFVDAPIPLGVKSKCPCQFPKETLEHMKASNKLLASKKFKL